MTTFKSISAVLHRFGVDATAAVCENRNATPACEKTG
jgi:hypothetical protein